MKAIHRGNGPSWNRIINWATTFIVAAFLFYQTSGLAGNGTNTVWLSLSGVSNGWLTLTLNGTQPGSNYTLLSQTTLTATNWSAAGLVTGAQSQSWTAVQVPLTGSAWFVRAQYYQSSGGGGTNSGGGGTNNGTSGYGTNLWLSSGGVSKGIANLAVANSVQDVWYEIQGKTNLLQPDWISYGFVSGSELTNWTPMSIFAGNSGNLFLRIRSWADSYNSGIPDWWWLQYFGQITNIDASAADPAGDGYSNWQKFQMGLNPTNYYNPNAPTNFYGCLDATGTNVVIEWSPSPGPVINYAIQRGIYNTNTGDYVYSQAVLVSSNATFFKDVGAISNANAWNNAYNLMAVYPGGSLSATNTWYPIWYSDWGSDGPPYGPPTPNNVYAYEPSTGTNVLISWTPPTPGAPTSYIIERGIYDTNTGNYDYSQIASMNTNTTYFQDVGVINNVSAWYYNYEVVAVYPGGGLSQPSTSSINTSPPPPTEYSATVDSTGTNVLLSWTPPQGVVVTNYIIERATYNTNTSDYSYSQIGQVNAGTTSFEDVGAITGNSSYNNYYEVEAVYSGGSSSSFNYAFLPSPPSLSSVNDNIYITAYLVRNGTGRWQVMFSGFPTNSVQAIQMTWTDGNGNTTPQNISTSDLINGIYPIADTDVVNLLGDSLSVQLFGPNGEPGQVAQAGVLANDAPYFVDGRQHMKQNLTFLIRGASLLMPYGYENWSLGGFNQTATNFEEFSFLNFNPALDDLWPFTANYELANNHLTITNGNEYYPAYPQFTFEPDFTTNIPAPAILDQPDPYWIFQRTFSAIAPPYNNTVNWGVTTTDFTGVVGNAMTASLQSGLYNLFSLPELTGCVEGDYHTTSDHGYCHILPPGSSVTITNIIFVDWGVGAYASQCPAPTLNFVNYYFAPLINPNGNTMNLPSGDQQPFPLPIDDSFNVTNQTPPVMVGSVGQPMILGGWAKYSVQGSSGKYAYLGQYFMTNAFLLNTSGNATTNVVGILSPYGEFFPLQAGAAALVTMPDIDTGAQGTGVVRVVSLNADANHDGTLDFTYAGPDQTSPSRPFRFWINDNQDDGDYGGDGIPGQGVKADGVVKTLIPNSNLVLGAEIGRQIHGRRDLVDFFPVYLNISSLFQSCAISAGISATDTNWQFVLSQADGALRFAYTDLTPTNYMNYLRDTNESGLLAYAPLTTISNIANSGVALSPSFVAGIATNNQGIILVEAWESTTQPLVLTIYKGTNQIAQTSLYLSISGVEQMFRHKNLLLDASAAVTPSRLTDASVPNEPDTTDVNFIFLHGYNVNPEQARGWDADIYKRLYWSGSHAKFYGITWTAADSQVANAVTINLQTNIVHAFATAPLLNTFLNGLTGTNVVAAHSLGNMLMLSTLNDYSNQTVSTYMMIDAAVAIEAIDINAPQNPDMYPSVWTNYQSRLWSSQWHNLFPANDGRSTLTWSGRLPNLQNASVYNFYSSGEEVLRDYPADPPGYLLTIAWGQFVSLMEGATGEYTWAWQEKCKGLMSGNGILSSDHGGWKFNDASYGTNNSIFNSSSFTHMSPAAAALLPNAEIKTNAFFDVTDFIGQIPFDWTQDLALYGTAGSNYAQANQNRLLSDTIPCLTLPVGANPIPDSGIVDGNFDMQTVYENGWPLGRHPAKYPVGTTAAGEWHHSDVRAVAYTFTYKLFNQMVTVGNLK
jgi:hypothetical protein